MKISGKHKQIKQTSRDLSCYRFFVSIGLLLFCLLTTASTVVAQNGSRIRTTSFDQGWHFLNENPSGAENSSFDDSKWRLLDLPHDWSIEDLPNQTKDSIIGPFSKAAPSKMATGYTVGGTAWYRKTFTVNPENQGEIVYLQFDGVYMNSDVWVNGKHLGNHPYGYTSFWYDITPYLNPVGQPNVVAVQVKNEAINCRWYSGSGIYRHTWLTFVKPLHVIPSGVYVTTPTVSKTKSSVEVTANFRNSYSKNLLVTYKVTILDPSGVEVGKSTLKSSVSNGKSVELKQIVQVNKPKLWSVEAPKLYSARVELIVDNKVIDKVTTSFGIRSIHFDAKTGFTLNGKNMKLKGGCIHHDNGPLGSAAIDRAEERKIEILKKSGFNSIRCSHNPPSPYLLDVCDRLGMLVIDESFDMWKMSKMKLVTRYFKEKGTTLDYSKFFDDWWQKDIQSMVLRDRNHPSVIMWSIGNEISESQSPEGITIARNLADEVRKYDATRPVTEAIAFSGDKIQDQEKLAPHMALLDVAGYNYGYDLYEEDHVKFPDRIMYASESNPHQYLEHWEAVEKLPYVIGSFNWAAMDYMGESGAGYPRLIADSIKTSDSNTIMSNLQMFFNYNSWPLFNSFMGDLDIIGNPKVPYYYQQVLWRNLKVSMFVHKPISEGKKEVLSFWGFPDELKSWNWQGYEGQKMQVHVYTRSQLVKLELNGKLVGEQSMDPKKSITATFEVPYESGKLVAKCFDNGIETSSEVIKTVGIPVAIRLVADRSTIKADRNDLSYVMVELIDAEGNVIPNAENMVNFEISGNGEIAGVGSGSPTDMSSFQQPHKKTWRGKCLIIIRPKGAVGTVKLKAKANGLADGNIKIITQ